MSLETAFEIGQAGLQIKRIADILSASQKDIFVRLPGLLAYFPMGIRRENGIVGDHTGSGLILSQTGVCPTGYDGNSFLHLGDGVNYLQSSYVAFGLTGLETWITSSMRGLTIGGWFMIDSTPSLNSGLVSKDGIVTNRGYALWYTPGGAGGFSVSSNGSAWFSVNSGSIPTGQWRFIVGRFTPSTELAIFADGDKSVNTTAIPSSNNVPTQTFEIGRYFNDDNRIIHGKARDVFVCAAALSDALIEEIRVTSTP